MGEATGEQERHAPPCPKKAMPGVQGTCSEVIRGVERPVGIRGVELPRDEAMG